MLKNSDDEVEFAVGRHLPYLLSEGWVSNSLLMPPMQNHIHEKH